MRHIFRSIAKLRSQRPTSVLRRLASGRWRGMLTALEDRTVPAIFTVNSLTDTGTGVGNSGDLRYCIDQANASAGVPDIINFDNATTAGQVIGVATTLVVTDELTINGPTLLGPGNPNVSIDGAALTRIFQINMTAGSVQTFSLNGVRLANGAVAGSGAAVLQTSVEDTFNYTDCVFDANAGQNYGGAIGSDEPALAVYGTMNITRCSFTNNSNLTNFGGALAFNMLISGAGVTKGWTGTVTDTTFDSNKNDRNGGAMFIRGYACDIKVTNTTFSNNQLVTDGFGGAISLLSGAGAQSSKLTFTNCTFSGNQNNDISTTKVLDGGCGAVFGNGGGATPTIVFRNCTLTNNSASFSGGLFAASSGTPTITLESSIAFGNTSTVGNPEFEGGIFVAKNSIIDNKAGTAGFTDLGGNQYGAAADPLLQPLGTTFGGLTAYHVPGSGSPARENGYADPAVTTDQRGGPRLLGTKVDVGSIESQDPTPIASATAANVVTPSVAKYQFTVSYSDDVAVLAATIKTGNVTVTGPNGFSDTPTLVGSPPGANGTPLVVMYEFTPPANGAAGWDFSDNGVYTINMVGGQVSDAVPNFVKAGALTTFSVGIPQLFTVNALGDTGVGSGTKGDLRYCITQANLALGAIDSITFDATLFNTPQTIKLGGTELAVLEGVNITGPGGGKVTISGEGFARVFNLTGPGSYDVNISGVTVANGNAAGDGGAFLVSDETLNLTDVVVSGNTSSGDGGAVVLTSSGGKLNAVNSTFKGNQAGTAGGAVATNANALVVLTGTTVENNTSGTNGGAIDLNLGNLVVSNSLLAGNSTAGGGGAVHLSQVLGTLSFSNSTLSGNSSATNGGAISTDHAGGTLSIRNTTITGNTSGGPGGGLFHNGTTAQPGDTVVVSSIIAGNTSTTSDVEVTAVKFTFNTSIIGGTSGGGVYIDGGTNQPIGTSPLLGPLSNNGGLTRTHGLLGGSPAIDKGSNPDSLTTDQRGAGFPRLVGAAVDIGAFEGVLPIPGGAMTAIPPIVTAGPTPNTLQVTYFDETGINVATIGTDDIEILAPDMVTKLAVTSVKVDNPANGSPRVATYTFTVPGGGWDLLDNGTYTVTLIAGKVSDIDTPTTHTNAQQPLGSFKVAVPVVYTVDLVSDVDDGNTSVGQLTLREAIGLANGDNNPSLIQFSPAVFSSAKTITMAAGEMPISAAVTIVGPTATLTLDANNLNRIFNIDDALNVGSVVNISNLTLTKGSAVTINGGAIFIGDEAVTLTKVTISNSITDSDGGAIFVNGGTTLRLVNCVISNNQATGAASQGGGIFMPTAGNLDIQSSTISGNVAGQNGGGWYFVNGGSLQVVDSTVTGNKADQVTGNLGGGGGYFFGAATGKGIFISGSTFSGNNSGLGLGGGGLMVQAGSGAMVIQNSTFSGNLSGAAGAGYGGAILVNGGFGGTPVLQNNTIAFNDAGKSGGGIAFTGGVITMNSNIVAKNTVAGVGNATGSDLFSLVTAVTGAKNLIGVNDPATKMTFDGPTNPLIGTTGAPIDPMLDPLANNGGPTFTHNLKAGSQALNNGNNVGSLAFDQRGTGFNRTSGGGTDIGSLEVQVAATPAKVSNVKIDDGTAQHSLIRSLTITFDQKVGLPGTVADAFTLTKQGGGAVTLAGVVDGTGTVVTLTFTGGEVEFTSLKDGRYNFTIDATKVTTGGGTIQLDGNGDGTGGDNFVLNSAAAPAAPTNVWRLFGDNDGDNDVDTTDFGSFRSVFGGTSTVFDFDGDGDVDTSDFGAFRARFGASV